MTRHKNYKDMQEHLSERHKQILEILENKEMTTREIAQELYKKHYTNPARKLRKSRRNDRCKTQKHRQTVRYLP